MSRRAEYGDPELLRQQLADLLSNFEIDTDSNKLRHRVQSFIPSVYKMKDLGVSLMPEGDKKSGQDRILFYLNKYPFMVVQGIELEIVSGISEYARRIRELRVEHGWPIYSGKTAKETIYEDTVDESSGISMDTIKSMDPDDYILVGGQDREAAYRWNLANKIRRQDTSGQARIISYLLNNVGRPVTGEEIRYVANEADNWGRRVRALRTEEGWPIATRNSGRKDLSVGVYILESDRQQAKHDRKISDSTKVTVLERDKFACQCCKWSLNSKRDSDPRVALEFHHIDHHASGGSNDASNLITLCNVHHDEVHRRKLNGTKDFTDWLESSCS